MPLHPWYAIHFQHRFETIHGTKFQDFIADILDRRYGGDFFKIKPYGKQGDKKCDGIIKSARILLQVYAPEVMKSATAKAKIDEDFPGAIKHWDKLFDHWVFLHNQYNGLPPDVAQHLIKLDGTNNKSVTHWCESQVLAIVEQLSGTDLQAIFGSLPDFRNLSSVTADDIKTVVMAVAQQPLTTEEIAIVPTDKLEANGLSADVKSLLRAGTQKAKNVADLFERWHDPELGDRIAAAFKQRYLDLKGRGEGPDKIFEELWRFAGGGMYLEASKERATLALLAFLFEQCDIFEAARRTNA